MYEPISAKQFRSNMQQVLDEVEAGEKRYTIIYRSKPKVDIIPVTNPNGDIRSDRLKNHAKFMDILQKNIGNTTNKQPVKLRDEKKIIKKHLRQKYGL